MGKRKPADEEGTQAVQRVLKLSDADFEKWMDRVERAGLKLKKS